MDSKLWFIFHVVWLEERNSHYGKSVKDRKLFNLCEITVKYILTKEKTSNLSILYKSK